MINKDSLAFRIISRALLITIILFFLILGAFYYFARKNIEEFTRENAILVGDHLASCIEKELKSLEKIPQTIAKIMEIDPVDPDSLVEVLNSVVTVDQNLYGVFICYEPDFFPEKGRHFCPFVINRETHLELHMVDYEYFYYDWYQIPAIHKKPYWSEPYFAPVGQAIMSTYSVPFYSYQEGTRKFAGVVALDVSLERLTELVAQIEILETGYAFLVSRNGVLLTHPNSDYIMNESAFSIAERMGLPELRIIGRAMIRGESNFRTHGLERDDKLWIYYTPLSGSDWSIGVVYPNAEMYASLHQLSTLLILLAGIGFILLSFITYHIINRQISPLTLFSKSAKQIAEGNFEEELPCITTNTEMNELYNAFSHMKQELANYIENLKKTTAAKEKIESQLRIARDIQLSMVPRTFPAFPHLPQIDLYATLKSAREVGGDLYNFFMIDNDHMGFTIGDVSDKGVPAALFMAMTNTLIKANALTGLNPAQVLEKTNYELCQDNEQCMFVTLFFGILNINTGMVNYANAGHNPFILIVDKKNAHYHKEMSSGMVLGAFEEAQYVNENLTLKPGQTMFVYTDGVTEAMDEKKNQFGEEKLLDFIQHSYHLSTVDLINKTMEEIAKFVKGYEQSDDITLLALRFLSHDFEAKK